MIENIQNDYALYLEIQVFNYNFFSYISGKHLWLIIKKDEKEFQTITPDFFIGPTKNVMTVEPKSVLLAVLSYSNYSKYAGEMSRPRNEHLRRMPLK